MFQLTILNNMPAILPFGFLNTFDPDARAEINAVIAAGGSGEWGSTAASRMNNMRARNVMIKRLKAAGIYADLDYRCFAGVNTLAGAAVAGKGGNISLVNFVSGDLDVSTLSGGFKGDGTTKYISTDWAGNWRSQNDQCWGVWVTEAPLNDALNRAYFGNSNSGLAGTVQLFKGTNDLFVARCKASSTNNLTSQTLPAVKLGALSRGSASGYTLRSAGTSENVTQVSDGNLATAVNFFVRGFSNHSTARMSTIFRCKDLTAQFSALESIFDAYHNSILP